MPVDEAKVGVEDIGLLRGYGLYEGLMAFDGKPFRFADHWDRFLSGAHVLNLNVPVTQEKAEKVIGEILQKSGLNNRANLRMILTGGKAINGIEYDFDNPTFYILAEEWKHPLAEIYEKGTKLITYKTMRELPEYKTTNYIRAVNLQNFKKEEKAIDILYVCDGEVYECATSNIFIVKNKVIITPEENILKGITRKVVLELAEGKYEIEKRPIEEGELKTADEVFITSSFKDVVPVVKIDDFAVAGGEVGPITKDLMAKFRAYISVA